MKNRYEIISDTFGYAIIDTEVADGDEMLVDGSTNREKANEKCDQLNAHDKGDPCEVEGCQECCEHNEQDHFICLDCGHEGEPSDYFDEDYGQER